MPFIGGIQLTVPMFIEGRAERSGAEGVTSAARSGSSSLMTHCRFA